MPQEIIDSRKRFFNFKKKILHYQRAPEVAYEFECDLNIIVRHFIENKNVDSEIFSAFSFFLLTVETIINCLEENNSSKPIGSNYRKGSNFMTTDKKILKTKMFEFKAKIISLELEPISRCLFEEAVATIIKVIESEKTENNVVRALFNFISITEDTIIHLEKKP